MKKIPGYSIFINKELGKGSYGTVYVGQKQSNNEQCAIKIIPKHKIQKSAYLERALFSQINIMAKLQSINIVKFIAVLQSANNYYIVQELCESDLEQELKKIGKFSEQKAKQILTEICNGFLELVKQGIVHRDLKPSNLLIVKNVLKICDFGFAKINVHKNMKNQSNVGTPLYKPIEIFKNIPYTSKCDIWSLGIIFYELLHGRTPFQLKKVKTKEDLVKLIEEGNFKIDQSLTKDTRDFLQKTLQVYEKDRICWDEVYQHPIFCGKFEKYLDTNRQFENRYKAVLNNLQYLMNEQAIEVKELWENLGFSLTKNLNESEFYKFLKVINPAISIDELHYIMQKVDKKGNGKISFEQLQQQLQKNGIGSNLPLSDIINQNLQNNKPSIK